MSIFSSFQIGSKREYNPINVHEYHDFTPHCPQEVPDTEKPQATTKFKYYNGMFLVRRALGLLYY